MKGRFYLILITAFLVLGTHALGQTPTPTPDAQNVKTEDIKGVPAVAVEYRSDDRSFPDLGRVGVDMTQQKTLTMRDAIELALDNNRDIEVTRKNERIAEYDLDAARGIYQPRFTAQTYFDRSTVPNVSIFTSNQKTRRDRSLPIPAFRRTCRSSERFMAAHSIIRGLRQTIRYPC
ncbi:MAG: TolC family protein [Chloracidobacterium sp.]|nr:TolC family protein [Chloracidobacterium sp.]